MEGFTPLDENEIIVELRSDTDSELLRIYFSPEQRVRDLLRLSQEEALAQNVIGEEDRVARLRYPCGTCVSTQMPVAALKQKLVKLGIGVLADVEINGGGACKRPPPVDDKKPLALMAATAAAAAPQQAAAPDIIELLSNSDSDADAPLQMPTPSRQECSKGAKRPSTPSTPSDKPRKEPMPSGSDDGAGPARKSRRTAPKGSGQPNKPKKAKASAASQLSKGSGTEAGRGWVAIGDGVGVVLRTKLEEKLGPMQVLYSLQEAVAAAKGGGGGPVLVLGRHATNLTLPQAVDLWGCPPPGTAAWSELPAAFRRALPSDGRGLSKPPSVLAARDALQPVLRIEGADDPRNAVPGCRVQSLAIAGCGRNQGGRPPAGDRAHPKAKLQWDNSIAAVLLESTAGPVQLKHLDVNMYGWGYGILADGGTAKQAAIKDSSGLQAKTRVSLEHCVVRHCGKAGVAAFSLTEAAMRHCTVASCGTYGGYGVEIQAFAGCCHISDCAISDCFGAGVLTIASEPMTIQRTQISRGQYNEGAGELPAPGVLALFPQVNQEHERKLLHLLEPGWQQRLCEQGHHFIANTVNNNTGSAFVMKPGLRCVMDKNVIKENQEAGLHLIEPMYRWQTKLPQPLPHVLTRNVISGNGDAGIAVSHERVAEIGCKTNTPLAMEDMLCQAPWNNTIVGNREGGLLIFTE